MIYLLLLTSYVVASPQPLLVPFSSAPPASCCPSSHLLLSCTLVEVQAAALVSGSDLMLPGDLVLSYSSHLPPSSLLYTSRRGEQATLTHHSSNTTLLSLRTLGGLTLVLEPCRASHVWREHGLGAWPQDRALERGDTLVPLAAGPSDNTTMITISLMVYFTAEFAAVTPHIQGFVEQVWGEGRRPGFAGGGGDQPGLQEQ